MSMLFSYHRDRGRAYRAVSDMQSLVGTFGHSLTDEGFGHEVFGLANYFGCRVGNPSVSDVGQRANGDKKVGPIDEVLIGGC